MPGSSVSACHLCHLHSHSNHDNLVKTSPLRHSRWKNSKHSSHSTHGRHSHGHSHGQSHSHSHGSCSSRDGERVRSSSASALARLTESSHSLPGSRSNSLSRFHREVSILPDGGDPYDGDRALRHSSSTRSLDNNPAPISTTILETRTPSLPRVSTPLQPHIHVQPDIIVNAMPRSRTNSRSSGSVPRNTVNVAQDTSQDYYLDMQRQRFKEEEKKKHKFNLQTVMLIGCYTLLIMIAIVVGVVLCYQNGWLGFGSSQEKLSEERMFRNNSNFDKRNSLILQNRRKHHDKNLNRDANNNDRSPMRNRENGNLNNFGSTPVTDFGSSSSLTPNVHGQLPPSRNNDEIILQRNTPRQISNSNIGDTTGIPLNNHRIPSSFGQDSNFNQGILINQSPDLRTSHSTNENFAGSFPSHNFNPSQIPINNNNNNNVPATNRGNVNTNTHPNLSTGIPLNINTNTGFSNVNRQMENDSPVIHNSNTPINRQTLGKTDVINRPNINSNIPSNFESGIPLNTNLNINNNRSPNNFNSPNDDNIPSQTASHPRMPRLNTNDHSNRQNINDNVANPTFQTGIPLNTNSNFNRNDNFNNAHLPNSNINSQPLSPSSNSQSGHRRNSPTAHQINNPTIQQGPNPTLHHGINLPIQLGNNPSTPQVNNHPSQQGNSPVLQREKLNSNTIAKTLLQGGFLFPGVNRSTKNTPSFNSNVHNLNEDNNSNINRNINSQFPVTSGGDSLPSISEKLLTSDTSSLTTQELLDLLAIRRMRDLLNSRGNTRDILDLLRKVDESKVTRLEQPKRDETLVPTELQDKIEGDELTRRGSGINIKGTIRSGPQTFQIGELIAAINEKKHKEEISNAENLSSRRTTLPPINRDHTHKQAIDSPPIDNHSSSFSLNSAINRTLSGAIIRLLNDRASNPNTENLDSDLNFNVSGVTVFPVNSEDLRILLESNPENIKKEFGSLSGERLRSLQLLQTLIELNNNNKKQKVQRHIHSSSLETQNADDSSIYVLGRPNSREVQPPSIVSQSRDVVPRVRRINKPNSGSTRQLRLTRNNPRTSGGSLKNFTPVNEEVSTTAESILVSRRRRPSASSQLRAAKPDPEFSVMVKTETVTEPQKTRNVVFPPPYKTRNRARSTPSNGNSPPNKERVAIQPGRRRVGGNTALVRAWTHMDSTGTLSKGSVHSDGSFTFTNCRPVDVCNDEKQDGRETETKKYN